MKTILRAALSLVLLMALGSTTALLADEKENENAPRQGTVRGRIIALRYASLSTTVDKVSHLSD